MWGGVIVESILWSLKNSCNGAVMRLVTCSFLLSVFLLSLFSSYASASSIVAKAVAVEGKATRTSPEGNRSAGIVVGDTFSAGDTIKTSVGAIVEIEFDTGSLMLIGSDTQMTIKNLDRKKDGTTRSVFGLLFGRIKTSVVKLLTRNSLFEYHTKAAVCGVAGTPPFVVEYQREQEQTNIDLLGKPGQKGAVYVQGRDRARTRVDVLPGQHSSVRLGKAPLKPVPIPPARFRSLTKGLLFRTKPDLNTEAEGGDKTADGEIPPPIRIGSPATPLTTSVTRDAIFETVSTKIKPAPSTAASIDSTSSQVSTEQGTVGEVVGGNNDLPPSTARGKVEVTFR